MQEGQQGSNVDKGVCCTCANELVILSKPDGTTAFFPLPPTEVEKVKAKLGLTCNQDICMYIYHRRRRRRPPQLTAAQPGCSLPALCRR